MFRDKYFVSFVLVLVFLFLLSLSSVSAAEYNFTSGNNTEQFQSVIDSDKDEELVINLEDGDYGFSQINVSRNATIQGKGQSTKISGIGSGILFNITANNVKIINLTITNFTTAIQSNSGDLTITNNNINTIGISIDIQSAGTDLKGINIENNFIVSSITNYNRGVLYIYAPDNSHVMISVSLIGNTIIGNSSTDSNGVRIRAVGCISNIIFTNNNITGTYGGIYLYAGSSSKTNMSFINNNITGKSRYGVSFGAESNNNSQFTFIDNNIAGAYGGISLDAVNNINTNISFTNNNITGTSSGGVHLSSYNSRNINISFTFNNITGKSGKGIQLSSYSSNNTNISFTFNNITGIGNGVDLYAYKNSKSQIIFSKNYIKGESIKGEGYGVYVFSLESNVNGVSFLNNTINSSGDGFYFEYLDFRQIKPTISISNFTIIGNTIIAKDGTGLNFTGLYSNCRVNVTVHYNRIVAPVGVNIGSFNKGSSFDFNWWGVNDITGKTLGVDTLNHYILNITNNSSLDDLKTGDNVSFAFLVLNTTMDNDGVENLPYFSVNGTFNGENFTVDNDSNFTGNFNMPVVGAQFLDATLDNQYVIRTFSVKNGTNSSINIANVQIGTNAIITGHLTGYVGDGSDILTVTVDGNAYIVIIGSNGSWNLNYTTKTTGNITIIVTYLGNDNYTGFSNSTIFEVFKNSTNSSIVVGPGVTVNKNVSISGQLDNYTGISSVNVTVDGNLYTNVSVNVTGGWNLTYTTYSTGVITVVVSFVGDDNFNAFSNSSDFTVDKNSINSTIVVDLDSPYIGTDVTISGNLTDYVGNGLDYLIVIVDGNDYIVTISDTGVWDLSYVTNRTGNIIVQINYNGNDNYTKFTNSSSFNVLKAITNSSIIISPSNVVLGNDIIISGYLTNYTGIIVVNVTVDGNNQVVDVDNETGFWSLKYRTVHTGIFKVVVSLSGDSHYEDFINTKSFTVNKINLISNFTVSGKLTYGETITIKSKLYKTINNGLSLKGKLIKFYVNNKLIGSKKTDSSGLASLNYKIVSTKKLTFKSVFAGDSEYNSKTSNTISKTPSKAKISMILSSKFYKKRIKVILKFKGKVLKSKWVKFYIKGKYVGKAKTNRKGIALFKYTKRHGKLAVKTIFTGDNLFKSIKYKRKIKL
ncbi:MAG: hypothetical protein KO253_03930 [Methanobrevibacter arboriphilus]|nr:hypothetical protein [Methanobrevibacter arboriphilus]